ncbi:MAG TPA: tautomerase family protein [Bradyrhizobium sp.]|jgi:phenylpyruvate tautomerase PptA (4-oxalocrotonate tautomerase family)
MPLTRISLRRGKPAAYRKAICDSLYRAMREALNVPEGDRFILITEHDEVDFDYGASWPGVARSDDLVFIQLTVNSTRTLSQKKALYRRLVQLLSENPGLRPDDVFISLIQTLPENWSVGFGEAQFAPSEDAVAT